MSAQQPERRPKLARGQRWQASDEAVSAVWAPAPFETVRGEDEGPNSLLTDDVLARARANFLPSGSREAREARLMRPASSQFQGSPQQQAAGAEPSPEDVQVRRFGLDKFSDEELAALSDAVFSAQAARNLYDDLTDSEAEDTDGLSDDDPYAFTYGEGG